MKRVIISSVLLGTLLAGVVAAGESGDIKRLHVYPWEASVGYSQIVVAGRNVYLSGVTSEKDTLAAQLEDIYTQIGNQLAQVGLSYEHIVKEVIFTTDLAELQRHGSVQKAFFAEKGYPASSWVEVAALFTEHHMVEVEVVAFMPETLD